jgi:hypothetical protein
LKYTIIAIIVLIPAFIVGGCSSILNDLSLTTLLAPAPSGPGPRSMAVAPQPVAIASRIEGVAVWLASAPARAIVPAYATLELETGQPVQLDTLHLTAPHNLAEMRIAVNGQPIDPAAANPFPATRLKVEVCTTYQWWALDDRTFTRVCPSGDLQQLSTVAPRPNAASNAERISLILTGYVPGAYRLTLTAIDTTKKETELNYLIKVAN